MKRRDFLAKVGVVSAVLISGVPMAQADEAAKGVTGKEISKDKLKAAVDAAFDCLKTGEACLSHCNEHLGQGDTSLKLCQKNIENMLAACTALSKIGSYDTAKPEIIKHLASVCSDLCKECSAACKVHASHHAVCKACMESCDKCAAACDGVVAA